MKVDREKPPYLPKVAFVRLHTAGREVKDYREEFKGQGFTSNQFKHMKKADELWDGLELWVSMWDYDNHESWHLWNWKKEDDNRVMLALFTVCNCLFKSGLRFSGCSAAFCCRTLCNTSCLLWQCLFFLFPTSFALLSSFLFPVFPFLLCRPAFQENVFFRLCNFFLYPFMISVVLFLLHNLQNLYRRKRECVSTARVIGSRFPVSLEALKIIFISAKRVILFRFIHYKTFR